MLINSDMVEPIILETLLYEDNKFKEHYYMVMYEERNNNWTHFMHIVPSYYPYDEYSIYDDIPDVSDISIMMSSEIDNISQITINNKNGDFQIKFLMILKTLGPCLVRFLRDPPNLS